MVLLQGKITPRYSTKTALTEEDQLNQGLMNAESCLLLFQDSYFTEEEESMYVCIVFNGIQDTAQISLCYNIRSWEIVSNASEL